MIHCYSMPARAYSSSSHPNHAYPDGQESLREIQLHPTRSDLRPKLDQTIRTVTDGCSTSTSHRILAAREPSVVQS
jgi:hypothetical protein